MLWHILHDKTSDRTNITNLCPALHKFKIPAGQWKLRCSDSNKAVKAELLAAEKISLFLCPSFRVENHVIKESTFNQRLSGVHAPPLEICQTNNIVFYEPPMFCATTIPFFVVTWTMVVLSKRLCHFHFIHFLASHRRFLNIMKSSK